MTTAIGPTLVDPTARVDAGAALGNGVSIGPYCVVGPHVMLGDGCKLIAHVHVSGHTAIGARTVIYPFSSLGTPPQSARYRGGPTRLAVGADCDIRESVTMNTGTEDDRGITSVGDRCSFMAGAHVAHDCDVGNDVIFANNAGVAGHVVVGDHVFIGGHSAIRQFVRLGEGAMIVGVSGVRADVIPWATASGSLAHLVGLNVVGMKRRGYSKANMLRVRQAYQELFHGRGTFRERVDAVAAQHGDDALVGKIITFIRGGKRPFSMPKPEHADRSDAAD